MTSGPNTGWLTGRRLACLAGLALAAGGFVLLATHDGVGLGADDAVYAGVARSVASGHGLNTPIHYYPLGNVSIGTPPPGAFAPTPTPMVVYAPLEPVFLSAGGQHPIGTARVEDTIFFALTVLLAGLFVLAVTDELWLAAAAQLIIGLSLSTGIDSAGTEAAALLFAMIGLGSVMRYRAHPRIPWLILGSLAVGLATVTRFAAGGLIVWGVLALWRRWRAAVAYLVMSSLPLAGWFVYEKVAGPSTGHYVGLHVVKTSIRAGIHGIAFWILPTNSSTVVAVLGAFVVTVVVIAVLWRTKAAEPRLLVLFAVVQIVILEVAITFFDAGVNLDSREFVPVFLAVVIALACGIARTKSVKLVTVVLVAACALRFGLDVATQPPGGYTTPKWQHSPIMAAVRALPARSVVYTDAPDVIYLLANRATSSVPETVDFSTLKDNPRFNAQISEIKHTLTARGGYVVYIRGLGRDPFLPTEATLRRLLSLHVVDNTSDGAIYTIGAG
jgi:hypothetical protein